VREFVVHQLREHRSEATVAAPSGVAGRRLAALEFMLDASPEDVTGLRRHATPAMPIGPGSPATSNRGRLGRLSRLGRRELLIDEPTMLGGDVHAADAVRYYECLLAMAQGAILTPLADPSRRSLVWEIGAGWGGLAYRLKRLFPSVTYVITDLPEMFLLSATYLMTAFPDASVAFHVGAGEIVWEDHDFVFVPNTALAAVAPDELDLTISVAAFEEMTTAQVDAYVAHAYERGSRYLYSFDRERAPGNGELTGVAETVASCYWPHEIELPATKPADGADGFRHVIGWRRVRR
jgi:hypothetical protein